MKIGDVVKLRNGVLCQVICESIFGKWLLVELTGKSEPPLAHWYNHNSTFYAGYEGQLDVVEVINLN